jgi:hypothetical protein
MALRKVLIICILISPITSYFSYQDCDLKCRKTLTPCIIIRSLGYKFTSLCLQASACHTQADYETPCIQEDRPTIGGESLWQVYKNRYIPPVPTTTPKPCPPPKPCPKPAKCNCNPWKTMSIIQSAVSLTMLTTIGILKALRFRARLSYEPLRDDTIDDPESPYQRTTENITQDENIEGTSNRTEEIENLNECSDTANQDTQS